MVCIMIIGYKCYPIRDIGQHEKESGFSSDYEKKRALLLSEETPLFFMPLLYLVLPVCQQFFDKNMKNVRNVQY